MKAASSGSDSELVSARMVRSHRACLDATGDEAPLSWGSVVLVLGDPWMDAIRAVAIDELGVLESDEGWEEERRILRAILGSQEEQRCELGGSWTEGAKTKRLEACGEARRALRADPFRPFSVTASDGRGLPVSSPESVLVASRLGARLRQGHAAGLRRPAPGCGAHAGRVVLPDRDASWVAGPTQGEGRVRRP